MESVVAESARPSHFCRRLPNWFVVAIGLFSADSYRQVFRWLNPFRTPGRSTLCMARRRLGVAPVRSRITNGRKNRRLRLVLPADLPPDATFLQHLELVAGIRGPAPAG